MYKGTTMYTPKVSVHSRARTHKEFQTRQCSCTQTSESV